MCYSRLVAVAAQQSASIVYALALTQHKLYVCVLTSQALQSSSSVVSKIDVHLHVFTRKSMLVHE
jgi:hypothetical protein